MKKKSLKKDTYTIAVHCNNCRSILYRYKKEGGGTLIKCYVDMIIEDYTNGDLKCPKCNQEFARNAIIHNRPAHKIIGGKVFVKGHHGK
jgi:DNA-directed RNA polymerase subunit M/transcription elongation factor TFIIS